MNRLSGMSSLLVLLLVSSGAFAGDPLVEDFTSSFSNPAVLAISILVNFAVVAILIMAQWKLFAKAGEPGWAVLVPVYNAVLLMKIAGKPGWWVILMFVPFANLVVFILMNIGLARNFGRSDGFAAGLIFLPYIFLAVLGFGDSRYSQVEQSL